MISSIHTGATLLLKAKYDDGTVRTIGYARGLNYTVTNGQKETYVVDTPFPVEISQGTAPTMVKGSIVLYLLKGTTPEILNIVSHRTDEQGNNLAAMSRYMSWQIVDRALGSKVLSLDNCKVGSYTVSVYSRSIAEVNLQFSGILASSGAEF